VLSWYDIAHTHITPLASAPLHPNPCVLHLNGRFYFTILYIPLPRATRTQTFGASADGLGSLQTPKTNPSWLKAQYIAWAPSAVYDILFPHGTYKQKTTEDWLMGLTMPNPDVVYDNIKTVHENEAHTDFWKKVEMQPADYANVRFPNAFWGGWSDLFIVGTLTGFDGYNTQSDMSVRYTSKITIDPCGHCLEAAEFYSEDSIQGRTALVFGQLFEVMGIRPVSRSAVKNVTFYVMSSNDDLGKAAGNYWTSIDTWPAARMTDFYLHGDKTATQTIPKTSDTTSQSTSYKYDPADPVPTLGGNNLPDSIGGSIPCGPLDQTPVDSRADVLTFDTPVFDSDLPLTGPLFATIFVGSDAIDTDFTVKISDIYPNGGPVRLLQDSAVRMRWRENGITPVPMKNGEVYKMEVNLWNTSPNVHVLKEVQTSYPALTNALITKLTTKLNDMIRSGL
jgi:putative CocE/NonD family hydrolase